MAETMEAADMPGLHSKLLKLHRNLGDYFNFYKDLLAFFVFSFSSDGRCPAFIDEEYTKLTEICEWEPSNFDWIQVYVLLGVTSESFSFSDGMMASQTTEELMVWMTCSL